MKIKALLQGALAILVVAASVAAHAQQLIPMLPFPVPITGGGTGNFPSGNNQGCLVSDSEGIASNGQNMFAVKATGGTPAYTFTTSGMPAGLTFTTSSPQLLITANPIPFGTYNGVTITANDSAAGTGTETFNMVVSIQGYITLTPVSSTGTITVAASAVTINNNNRGMVYWLGMLSNGRVTIPMENNFSHAGDTTTNVLARMAAPLAANCGFYVVQIGTNDLNSGGSPSTAQIEANIQSIWSQLLTNGKPVIVQTIGPRSLQTVTGQATMDQLWAVDRWMRTQNGTVAGLYVVDYAPYYGNPQSQYAIPTTGATTDYNYSFDGLHCKGVGCYYAWLPVVSLLSNLFPFDPGYPVAGNADQFSANNPNGNLLPNGMMTATTTLWVASTAYLAAGGIVANTQVKNGTNVYLLTSSSNCTSAGSGGPTGTGSSIADNTCTWKYLSAVGTVGATTTGVIPDGWASQLNLGGASSCGTFTGVYSSSTFQDGVPAEQVVISGTCTAGSATDVQLKYSTTTLANFAAGDKIQAGCRIEVEPGSSHITEPTVLWTFTSGQYAYIIGSGANGATAVDVADASAPVYYSGTAMTPDPNYAFPAGLPSTLSGTLIFAVNIYLTNQTAVAVSATVKIGACSMRKQ